MTDRRNTESRQSENSRTLITKSKWGCETKRPPNQRLNPTVRTERKSNAIPPKGEARRAGTQRNKSIIAPPRGVRVGEYSLRRISRDALGCRHQGQDNASVYQMNSLTPETVRGQIDRFDTFEEFGDYFRQRLSSTLTGLVAFVFGMIYFRSRFDLDPFVFWSIMFGMPIMSVVALRLTHARYSKPGYIQVTDEEIIRFVDNHEESFSLASLRDIELPSKKEMRNGADYVYLYFGDGTSLELERYMPNFPQIKHSVMRRIAIHPDLDFLRKRLSKAAT